STPSSWGRTTPPGSSGPTAPPPSRWWMRWPPGTASRARRRRPGSCVPRRHRGNARRWPSKATALTARRLLQRASMKIRTGVVVALPVVTLVGCATPGPIVRLAPDASDVVWVAGRAVTSQEDRGVRVAAAFDHQASNLVAFRVEFENDTDQRIEVGPENVA